MHLSEEALDFVGAAAASPEVEVEPHLPPETNTRFHQGLHSIKLATLVPGIVVAESMLDSPDEEGVTLSVSITVEHLASSSVAMVVRA